VQQLRCWNGIHPCTCVPVFHIPSQHHCELEVTVGPAIHDNYPCNPLKTTNLAIADRSRASCAHKVATVNFQHVFSRLRTPQVSPRRSYKFHGGGFHMGNVFHGGGNIWDIANSGRWRNTKFHDGRVFHRVEFITRWDTRGSRRELQPLYAVAASTSINLRRKFFTRKKHLGHPWWRSGRGDRKSRNLCIPPVFNATIVYWGK